MSKTCPLNRDRGDVYASGGKAAFWGHMFKASPMNEEFLEGDARGPRELASQVLAANLRHNALPASDVPGALRDIHRAFEMAAAPKAPMSNPKPAVPIRRSITRHYIICLEDGRKMKTPKCYLRSKYDLTPEDYRAKWNLPAAYPMVAPAYAAARSALAKKCGLGLKPGARRKQRR